jgi:hypothetical protein
MNDQVNKPAPLTAEQQAARLAALKAATATPSPANAPTIEAKPGEAVTVAKSQTPTTGDGKATVTGDRGAPVDTKPASVAGQVTTTNPHTAPLPKSGNGQGGIKGGKAKGETKAKVDVSAAKPKVLGKAETAMAAPGNVAGYDLSRWQRLTRTDGSKTLTLVPPDKVHVLIARALRNGNTDKPINRPVSMNELSLAYGFTKQAYAHEFNVYDIGLAAGPVLSLSGDHKMNVFSRARDAGLITINKGVAPGARSGKNKAAYAAVLTAKGRAQVLRAAETQGFTVPKHLLPEVAGKGGLQAVKPDAAPNA